MSHPRMRHTSKFLARAAHRGRSGFTLVEMLVSTALVLLIMVLFAQIYGAAVGTLREQEGIAKNDAKARSVVTMLRNDLRERSYREIPLAVSDPLRASVITRGIVPIHPRCMEVNDAQRGYFYISENDPGNDSDDVLSFTMFLRQELGHFTGRVAQDTSMSGLPNHPDSDDAVVGDGVTSSRAAIVTYYMREGKLHRRINLLRDPLVIPNPYDTGDAGAGALTWLPVQPSNEPTPDQIGLGNPLFTATDFTNWYQNNALAVMQNVPPSTVFSNPMAPDQRRRLLSVKSLDNSARYTNTPVSLPLFRDGHVSPSGNPSGEYTGTTFIGRSALSGNRTGEDIVLSGVVGFDVKIWEQQDGNANGTREANFEGVQRIGRFVDLGHGALTDGTTKGPFGDSVPSGTPTNSTWGRNSTSTYGPGGPSGNRVFDTWHPLAPTGNFPGAAPSTSPAPTTPEAISPPFYPLKIAPDKSTAALSWGANSAITVTGTDWTAHQVYFPWAFRGDYSIGYRATTSGNTGTREPVWSRIPGDKVLDGGVTWECFDNRIGLTAMRITIRFVDPGSDLIRQVTLDHSFLD